MEEINFDNKPVKRPQLLTVIAILSFIGSGVSFLSYVMMGLSYDTVLSVIQTQLSELYPQVYIDFIQQAGRLFFVVGAIAYAGSLYGVYKMWMLQKVGLHYYAVSQFIILLLPLIFVSRQLSILPGLLITLLFVLLYDRSFKMIKNEK